MNEKELIKYLRNIGLEVHTSTKAHGHQGFYRRNRIDISKNIQQERIIPTLLHEFAHYIHSQIEPFMEKNGGTLQKLFDEQDISIYEKELLKVTNFVDKNSKFEILFLHKEKVKKYIHEYEQIIKKRYPKFQRSKNFKEFDKYIKNSKAKYLLKHDRVKLISGVFFKRIETFSIDNIEKDFDISPEFAAYIRLKSCQKKQARISAKINKLKKYYSKPTELFARFVEGLYLNHDMIKTLAPHTYNKFFYLLDSGYYPQLKNLEFYFQPKSL